MGIIFTLDTCIIRCFVLLIPLVSGTKLELSGATKIYDIIISRFQG